MKRNSKTLDPLENEENYNEEDVLPEDYPEPRLFVISNNDNGVELLSDKQLNHYFEIRKEDPNVNRLVENIDNKSIVQMVARVPGKEEINAKHIKPDFTINLDVFHFEKEPKKYYPPSTYVMRTFIRHEPVSEEDRRIVN